jgi:predicted nucleic acid-binding protein
MKNSRFVLVFDTSVVSELCHAGILEKLIDYRNVLGENTEFILPEKVFEELQKGRRIAKCSLLGKIFRVVQVPDAIAKDISFRKPRLGPGELSVLAVAVSLMKENSSSCVVAVIDEKIGRGAAEELGLKVHGFLWILIEFKKHGIVDTKKALEIVEELQERGFRVAEELLMETIETIKKDC